MKKNSEIKNYFTKLQNCNLTYGQQPSPKGFGDAVLKAKSFVNNDSFLFIKYPTVIGFDTGFILIVIIFV